MIFRYLFCFPRSTNVQTPHVTWNDFRSPTKRSFCRDNSATTTRNDLWEFNGRKIGKQRRSDQRLIYLRALSECCMFGVCHRRSLKQAHSVSIGRNFYVHMSRPLHSVLSDSLFSSRLELLFKKCHSTQLGSIKLQFLKRVDSKCCWIYCISQFVSIRLKNCNFMKPSWVDLQFLKMRSSRLEKTESLKTLCNGRLLLNLE